MRRFLIVKISLVGVILQIPTSLPTPILDIIHDHPSHWSPYLNRESIRPVSSRLRVQPFPETRRHHRGPRANYPLSYSLDCLRQCQHNNWTASSEELCKEGTPACCREAATKVVYLLADRVFDHHKFSYSLKGGSLLSAIRCGSMGSFDYDLDAVTFTPAAFSSNQQAAITNVLGQGCNPSSIDPSDWWGCTELDFAKFSGGDSFKARHSIFSRFIEARVIAELRVAVKLQQLNSISVNFIPLKSEAGTHYTQANNHGDTDQEAQQKRQHATEVMGKFVSVFISYEKGEVIVWRYDSGNPKKNKPIDTDVHLDLYIAELPEPVRPCVFGGRVMKCFADSRERLELWYGSGWFEPRRWLNYWTKTIGRVDSCEEQWCFRTREDIRSSFCPRYGSALLFGRDEATACAML